MQVKNMVYSALVLEVFIFCAIAENRGKIISMQRCTQEYGGTFSMAARYYSRKHQKAVGS